MNLLRRRIAILVLYAPLASAQSQTGILTGRLIDLTGAGVANARVELKSERVDDRSIVVFTNSGGDFKVLDVPTGEYTLESFISGFTHLTIKGVAIAAGEEKHLPPARFELGIPCVGPPPVNYMRFLLEQSKTGGLGGRVQVDDGPLKGNSPPVADAEVKLLCGTAVCATTKTDQDGVFLFSNVNPGEVSLLVRRQGFYPKDETGFRVESGRELTYYPIYLEKCSPGDCDPAKRPKKIVVCE